MLDIIFQYGWEPILIQRMLNGFEAIRERLLILSEDFFSKFFSVRRFFSHSIFEIIEWKIKKKLFLLGTKAYSWIVILRSAKNVIKTIIDLNYKIILFLNFPCNNNDIT